ncbi:MAG: Na+/H+ antiporter NhaC family protein [Candidatus Marinimicrobia bacterium]|nr:Na+/H+ antiporter NhaC family protein [Candidatus Neomarinimicrobiota bacterium]
MAQVNADKWGIWTLIPPLVAIILAFITKNVLLSLFTGVFSGVYILLIEKHNIFSSFVLGFLKVTQEILEAISSPWNAGIILQTLTIGGLIALISKMGGAKAIAESLSKKAKSPTSAQIYTWLLGIVVFFDDYANALTVGPIMRPVTDKMRISREKLSFIIDSTAAPIAGIALISTWVGYELGLIKDGFDAIGQDVSAYGIFISTIPFRFYNIFILIFIFISAILLKEFGPMRQAELRTRKTGKVHSDTAELLSDLENQGIQPKGNIKLRIVNAVLPILTLIIVAFLGLYYNGYQTIMAGNNIELIDKIKDIPLSWFSLRHCFSNSNAAIVLFQAALFSSILAAVMGRLQKIFSIKEAIEIWVKGVKSLIITILILALAWTLSSIVKELGTARYLVSILSGRIPPFLLSSIIFILGAIISFATGTSYGTMGILMPLTIPLAYAISPDPLFLSINIGAVLTGAIFGDHCSPISDTTILSSMGASCDHIDHVRTQLFYAIPVAIIAILFGYIPASLGVPVWLSLSMGSGIIFLMIFFVGKKVDK